MKIFFEDGDTRGKYAQLSLDGSSASAAYLSISGGASGGVIPSSEGTFVTGMQTSVNEKYSIVQCFGNSNYIYAFGHNPNSTLTLSFAVLLTGPDCSTVGNALKQLYGQYSNYMRVSSNSNPVATVTLGSATFSGYVTGLSVGQADAEHNIMYGTVTMIVPSIEVI